MDLYKQGFQILLVQAKKNFNENGLISCIAHSSKFAYFSLIWMFDDITVNSKTNDLHERNVQTLISNVALNK